MSSKTEAEAKSAFADIGVTLTKTFCSSDRDGWDPVQLAYKPNVTDIKVLHHSHACEHDADRICGCIRAQYMAASFCEQLAITLHAL